MHSHAEHGNEICPDLFLEGEDEVMDTPLVAVDVGVEGVFLEQGESCTGKFPMDHFPGMADEGGFVFEHFDVFALAGHEGEEE